jgi:hypothetical protein
LLEALIQEFQILVTFIYSLLELWLRFIKEADHISFAQGLREPIHTQLTITKKVCKVNDIVSLMIFEFFDQLVGLKEEVSDSVALFFEHTMFHALEIGAFGKNYSIRFRDHLAERLVPVPFTLEDISIAKEKGSETLPKAFVKLSEVNIVILINHDTELEREIVSEFSHVYSSIR